RSRSWLCSRLPPHSTPSHHAAPNYSRTPVLPGITAACTAQPNFPVTTSGGCWIARYPEGRLMDTLTTENPPAHAAARPPKIWKFWGTILWGLFIFGAMFAGQLAVFGYFVLQKAGPLDLHQAALMAATGVTISLSVITGVPAVAGACWIAIRPTRTP